MTYRLIETKRYQRTREALGPNARVSLPWALERIAGDPLTMEKRRLRPDGAIIDYGAQGLLIAYRILGGYRVRLLAVVDVKKAHRWV
jgi:hypothetical protein